MEPKKPIGGTKPADTTPAKRKVPGALVEDETLVGAEDGGVKTREPDGKIDEGATDRRENRARRSSDDDAD